ncbi:MAG: FadR family transcriptional regulator [Asticcacaulis sp.]|nr:FadR family transcriptional regulator [Asticcacaulis sp.]
MKNTNRDTRIVDRTLDDDGEGPIAGRGSSPFHLQLARTLALEIIRGERRPGDLLPSELDMSVTLSISRTAVRDAYRTLAAKGMVEPRSKRGTCVTEKTKWSLLDPDLLNWMFASNPDAELVRNLFEMRLIIEPAVAALAAQRRNEPQLNVMSRALDTMDRETLTTEAGQQADKEFHAALMAAAGNHQLASLNASIGASIALSTQYKVEHDILGNDPVRAHREVYKAIERRDPVEAKWLMESLIRQAMKDFIEPL